MTNTPRVVRPWCHDDLMTRPTEIRGAPRTHVADGQWPDGPLSPVVPAQYAQVLARNLRSAIASQDLTQEEVCRRTGLDRSTLWGILAGRRWPDLVSISRLEWGLGRRLWPLEDILLMQHVPPTESPSDGRRRTPS